MTANPIPADAVREALERLRAFLAHQSYSDGADPLDDLDTLAAHITALTEAQREAFQQYVDANEARIDAEARLAALAGAAANARDAALWRALMAIPNARIETGSWTWDADDPDMTHPSERLAAISEGKSNE